MYKRVIRWIKRVHLDRAYWSENMINFLHQEGIKAIIPYKSNSIEYGTDVPMDEIIRYQKTMHGLFKKNNKTHLRSEVEIRS